MPFADGYIENVLRDNFEDAKRFFLRPLLDAHYAHAVMLHRIGVLTEAEARSLIRGLDGIDVSELAGLEYDGSFEDLFFLVERLLLQACGEETAGKLHTARSRNDLAVALYRLRWRDSALDLIEAALGLRQALLRLASKHRRTILPIHTHTQPAQPSTLAHYLLGIVEHLERDHRRLAAALEGMNRCPLGACAITGTGFPIDRQLVSDLLGFDRPTGNTHGSIAAADYVLEAVAANMVLLVNLGKVIQDLLFWSTMELGFFRLGDGHVQPSSIMPQKRNPVALEHSRALASKALGQGSAVFVMIHNTPYGDINDVEDDLQPLVFHHYRDAMRVLRLMAETLENAEFDPAHLLERARENWLTLTELADTLVRREGLTFRSAHRIAARLVALRKTEPETPLTVLLARAGQEIRGAALQYGAEELELLLSPEHFVEVRQTPGGPAPVETERALKESFQRAEEDGQATSERRRLLGGFRGKLLDEARAI